MAVETLKELERIYLAIDKDSLLLVICLFTAGWFIMRSLKIWRSGNETPMVHPINNSNLTTIKDTVNRIEADVEAIQATCAEIKQTVTQCKDTEHSKTRTAVGKTIESSRLAKEGVDRIEEALK